MVARHAARFGAASSAQSLRPMSQNRRIQPSRSALNVLHRLADAVALVGGLYAAAAYTQTPTDDHHQLAAAAAVILFSLAAEITNLYRSWRGVSSDREL